MTISSGVIFMMSSSTIAGTTAAKAALTRIAFGVGGLTALVSLSAVVSRVRAFFRNKPLK
jgi:sulfite exporter TauE/SafE